MPDLGLTKAIGRAVRQGAKDAKVMRPAERELAERAALEEAEKLAKDIDVEEPSLKIDEPAAAAEEPAPAAVDAPKADAPELTTPKQEMEEAIPPPAGPDAQRTPPIDPNTPPPDPSVPPAASVVDEAFAYERATLGEFDLDASHQPNFDVMQTTDDVKSVIARTSEINKTKIDEARRGKITNEQLRALAGDLDVAEDVVRAVMERETGGVLNAETIVAARQVLISSAMRLKKLSGKIVSQQATDLEKVQFARQIQFHNEYQAQFMGARAEAGRSLNAFKIPVGGDATQIAKIKEILDGAGNIDALALAISRTNSVSGVSKVAKAGLFTRAAAASQGFINRLFVNGILSGPPTHVFNMVGNAMFQAMNTTELAVAARLGRFLGPGEHVEIGEALATLHGILSAFGDSMRLAGRALKEGKTLDDMVKFDTGEAPGGFTGAVPEVDRLMNGYIGMAIRGTEEFIGVPTRVLAAEDELFKTLAYRGYLERSTLLHVQEQIASGKATLENAAQVAREFMENPTPEIEKAAEDWARQMTFQAPLGPTGQKAQLFLRSVPVLTLIAPFIRTPVNIFKEGIARSPTAVFSARFWRAMRAGGRERDLAAVRFVMGSLTSAWVAFQVADGKLTGAGPQQPEARMLWEASGRRPYSILVKDPITGEEQWHSYARLEPIASVVGATADTVEILSYLNDDPEVVLNDDQEAYKAAGAIIAGIMNNTGNKTFMKGISDFVELLNDPTRNIKGYSNQMAVSVTMPYSSLLRFIRNTDDPYLREAWTVLDKMKDNTPGYSKDLPPRLGLFGELREKNSGSLLGTMSPLPDVESKSDPVIEELQEVMKRTRLVPATMPNKNIEGMRLTAEEYADFVRIARSEPILNGRTYYEELERTINTPAYQAATWEGRYELLKKIQLTADKAARAPGGPLEQQNPDYAIRIAEWRLEKERSRYGR